MTDELLASLANPEMTDELLASLATHHEGIREVAGTLVLFGVGLGGVALKF